MRVLALIFGILGGLCTATGILTALGVVPGLVSGGTAVEEVAYNTIGWGGLGGLSLMSCIAVLIARGKQ